MRQHTYTQACSFRKRYLASLFYLNFVTFRQNFAEETFAVQFTEIIFQIVVYISLSISHYFNCLQSKEM